MKGRPEIKRRWRLLYLALISCIPLLRAGAQTSTERQGPRNSRQLAERIHRVESEFPAVSLGHDEPPLQTDLQGLMQLFRVSGASVAVIDDFKIVWAKGYGFADAGGKTAVTTKTLFQAASMSKPVAAAAALRLVEQGKLSLDEDVNCRLVGWKVPENEFTKDQKVTLRRLLSHSAGVNIEGGFIGYEVVPRPSLDASPQWHKTRRTLGRFTWILCPVQKSGIQVEASRSYSSS